MAKAFKYGLKGITGYLEPAERDLLRSLINDVISMLQPEDRDGQDPLAALIGHEATKPGRKGFASGPGADFIDGRDRAMISSWTVAP